MNTFIVRKRRDSMSAARSIVLLVPGVLCSCVPPLPRQDASQPAKPVAGAPANDGPDGFLIGMEGAIKEVTRALELEDEIEKELFALVLTSGPKASSRPSSISVVILLPRKEEVIHKRFREWRNPDQPFALRLTRLACAAVSNPSAVIVYADAMNKTVRLSERVAFFDPVGRWAIRREEQDPQKREGSLGRGKKLGGE
jgi:hypothetical protein